MPNQALKDKLHNKDGDDKEKYTALAMQESRLNKAKEYCAKTKDCSEFNRLGGDAELKRLEGIIHQAQNANYQVKKTGMDTGRENQFLKTHTKDKDNANPTKVSGLPKINKGNISRKIMSNKEVYNESIRKIKYLIDYINKI